MLKRKKFKVPKIATVIGNGTTIKGDLSFTGGLHVDGAILGSVVADTTGVSALTLSEQGKIEGDVKVPYIILNGQVTGNVYASERVELASNAKVAGAVYYKTVEMARGAEVNGQLIHTQADEPRKLEYNSSEKKRRGASNAASEVREVKNNQPEAASGGMPEPGKSS